MRLEQHRSERAGDLPEHLLRMGGEQGVQHREHLPKLPQLHRAEVHTVPTHAHVPGDVGR